MAEPIEGAKVAKALDIYLGQLYGWVKAGKVKNHKPDGKYVVDGGRGLLVDLDEARKVWETSRKKGPRAPKVKKETTAPRAAEEEKTGPRRLKTGTLVSYEKGRSASSTTNPRPTYNVGQVLASTGRLTFMDVGNHRVHYSGIQIDHTVFGTDRLSTMMAKGVAHIERPVPVLGMVVLNFILEGKVELAKSLETWLVDNGLDVIIPEIMDVEDDIEPETVGISEENE